MTIKEELTGYFNVTRRRLIRLMAAAIGVLIAVTIFLLSQMINSRTLLQSELAKVQEEKQQLQANFDDAQVRIDSLTAQIEKLKAEISTSNTLLSKH